MKLPAFFNQVRSYNEYFLSAGLALLLGGVLAVLILNATYWWNIALVVLGLLTLALFLAANLAEVKAVGKKRGTVVKANLTLVSLAMLGIVIGLNYIVSRHPVRFDMTSNKIYTLSDQTLEVLKKLPQDVDVTLFTSSQRGNTAEIQKAQQLLEEYAKHSTKFHFRVVDGVKNPSEPRRLNITEVNTVVFQSGDNRKDVLQRDYVTYALQGRQPMPKFQGEAAFTQALMTMTDTSHLAIYFTKGHGEKDMNNPQPDGYNNFKGLLEKQNYTVKDLDLITTGKIPEDASVLAVLGPQKPFQPAEEKLIDDFLKRGGKLVLFVDPQVKSGLEPLLKDYGVSFGNDMAIDPTRCLPTDPRAVVPQYSYHPIVEKLSSDNIYMVMAFSQSVQKVDPGIKGVSQTIFLQTTDKGWGQKDQIG
ncbi:MAG TPA: GldG family protein, partial [bacterium]|nr:GldG family protein [bacterium]